MEVKKMRAREGILKQIDALLHEIPLIEYPLKKEINCLLPVDCSKDVIKVIGPLLKELRGFVEDEGYDSYLFGHFLAEKFESALDLEIYFPDEILAKLLHVFYSILIEIENLTYSLKKDLADLLIALLKKSKEMDKKLFKADWKRVIELVEFFYYPKSEQNVGLHSYQSSTCSVFIDLAKHIRRFYSVEDADAILDEFEGDLIAFHSKEALRAARLIALSLPFEGLSLIQIERVFKILKDKVGPFKRISSQFDIFIVYMLKKVTKYNAETLKQFNWDELSSFVFEQILPGSLKIPSPVKGARKISKLLTKSDVSFGEEIFESLGNNVPSRIAKWLVYTMQSDCYSQVVHEKLMFFLDSLRSLCHPSNYGQWSIPIELFLGYFAGTLAKQTNTNEKWLKEAPADLISVVVEKIWNLSELLVFARSGPALSGMCISSFTCINLANVRPQLIIPKMVLAVNGALESISEPHRTISAVGLLQVSMPNLMKSPIGIVSVLSLLPTVVFGIDSNDQLKTIRTLSLFLSFSEAACIEDISGESFDCVEEWSDSCQEAKELTGQFSDVFLLFTENIIAYLRTISQGTSNEHDDLSRMILAIANCVYARVSDKIAEICLEKWLELLEEDLGKMVTEIVGEIVSKIAKNHCKDGNLAGKLIEKLQRKVLEQLEKGDGQLGSKDQSNNALNNNLIILAHLLENSKEYMKNNSGSLQAFVLNVLTLITNRKSFLAGSRQFHSITMGLIQHEIREIRAAEGNGQNPFVNWARWLNVEDLKEGKDFEIKLAQESDGLLALATIESILNWTKAQVLSLSIVNASSLSKGESEKLFCLMQVIDNVNIDLLSVYNSFCSYNYGINEELHIESVAKKCLVLLKSNFEVLKVLCPIVEASGNLELEIQMVEIIGSVINGYPVNPEKSREKLKAIKRLNINYDRYHTDKDRPVSFWVLKAEAQFKLRRDLRFDLGDLRFESELMAEFDEFAGILFKYCFKPYHMLRISAQNNFRLFAHKYISKSRGYIEQILAMIESSANLTESEFKGVCFMLRNRFADMICEDFGLVDKFLRGLLKLSEMPVAQEVNESFDIINGTLNVFSDAYVPDARDDKSKVKQLILDLMTIAEGKSDKWTSQYLAMLSAHPMIEMCAIPELFAILAKFSLSKVAVIRNVAQNCFKVAIYGHVRSLPNEVAQQYWQYKDFTALKMSRSKSLARVPEICFKTWRDGEFEEFSEFMREYLKFLCLPTDEDEGSGAEGLQMEYMNFAYLGRWISMFGSAEMAGFMKIIEPIFMKESLDSGHQRALCEVLCAILCNSRFIDEKILVLLRKAWNGLAIENLELWTRAIDEPLMWSEVDLKEISQFFDAATSAGNETARIILGMKMIFTVYSQFEGEIPWIDPMSLSEKLLCLCSHEYSSIVMESSKLLALISLKNPRMRDEVILPSLFERRAIDNVSRAILQFFACSSTLCAVSGFWAIFVAHLREILQTLSCESVQMLTDAKKALLTLFLTKGAKLKDLNGLTQITLEYARDPSLPVKISKFCIELVQLLVQNNFALFHAKGAVEEFFKIHVDGLIESDQLHLRESSHGIILSLYQIDRNKSQKDIEGVTRKLLALKGGVKSEQGMKERHGVVLKASGIVLAEPYGLSKSLPALLTALSFYISDRSPISPLVRLTFNEFRRTHQDTWTIDRQLFDEDQLDAIGELLIAPSYYA